MQNAALKIAGADEIPLTSSLFKILHHYHTKQH